MNWIKATGLLLLTLIAVAPASTAAAQAPAAAAQLGYELALYGYPEAELGGTLRMSGVAYEVRGLAELRAMPTATVVARITRAIRQRGQTGRETVRETTVQADRSGRFTFELDVPEEAMPSPRLEVEVRRGDDRGRHWEWSLSVAAPHRVDLLTDRNLYEPGETVRVWSRLVHRYSDRPVASRPMRIRVLAPDNRPLEEQTLPTSPGGVVSLDVALPSSAPDGHYRVVVETSGAAATATQSRTFRVGRRTVERLLVEAELDQAVVPPAGTLTGTVTVRTPSGTPVVGARVELTVQQGLDPTVLRTDAQGEAPFRLQAPAFLSGDVAAQTLSVRVIHPAHGALHAAASYLLSRVEWLVSATAGGGALVPEVDDRAYLSVTDARGEPAPEGTPVEVSGPAVRGGSVRLTVDAHGLAVVPMRVPAGAAAPIGSGGAGCVGRIATLISVSIQAQHESMARACVNVAPKAQVLPIAQDAVVAPGGEVVVNVARRPEVRGREVLVEALVGGHAVAWTWLDGRESQAVLVLPRSVAGVVDVRARPAHPTTGRTPLNDEGAAAVGTGALTAVLVRPADAFALALEAGQDVYNVRERARIGIRTTPAPQAGYVALVARDLAAHGGEGPWSLSWIGGALDRAATDPTADGAELLLESALAAAVQQDTVAARPRPLVPPPWNPSGGSYSEHSARHRGQMRDPIALRDELLRRGIGQVMRQLEGIVSSLGADPAAGQGIVRRTGGRLDFDPDVIAHLVERRRLSSSLGETLGGERLTLAMLRATDPTFSFDAVARRVTRQRLMRLLVALVAFANPDDPNAARASSGEPPGRWLSRMVQLGLVPADALVDAWGGSFVFRNAGAGRPELVVSERAPGWELVSPGADGRAGSADDLRNPFRRAVPAQSPYAVASGEDGLMQRLSLLSPGQRVLAAMVQAFMTLGLAAEEERRVGVVTASVSEEMDAMGGLGLEGTGRGGGGTGEGTIGLGNLGTIGHGGGGGSGSGYGRGAGRRSAAPATSRARAEGGEAMDMEEAAEAEAPGDMRQQAQSPPPPPSGSRLAIMGELIREQFPATLFFLAEARLEAGGLTMVTVPLADALTTYRVEAIGWTGSGWSAVGQAEVRVDQDAMVDAPVPPFATTGDVLRLPVRVSNRTGEPLQARVEVSAEGGLRIEAPAPRAIEVPPHDAVETIVEVRVGAPAEGALVVRAVRASGGQPLDAVRRPLRVLPDARLVRESFEVLVRSGSVVDLELPEEASERGPGELHLAVGEAIFGDPAEWGESDPLWAGWALAMGRRSLPPELREGPRAMLTQGDPEDELYQDPGAIALAAAIAWDDEAVTDDFLRRALRSISRVLEEGGESDEEEDPEWVPDRARVLLALAPAVQKGGRRALRGDLVRVLRRLRGMVGDGAARTNEDPVLWARAAAALALTRGENGDSRAAELLRRVQRDVVRVGDEAWLESEEEAGYGPARVAPTALLALARIGLGRRGDAVPLVRNLAGIARGASQWDSAHRALACAAASLLTVGTPRRVTVRLDGRQLRVRRSPDGGPIAAALPGLGRPGAHRIELEMSEGAVALASVDLRYGLPWSATPARPAPVDLSIDGEPGARDTRAALLLTVHNRGARVLVAPVAEVDLPAGAELDEPTREALEALTRARPTREGRTVRIELRPLTPGATVRLPIPVRWSVAGRVRGLGVTVFDDATPRSEAHRPTAVLPSMLVELPDEGAEPEPPEAEVPPAPQPPPPEPIPLPFPEPLGPVSALPGSAEVRS